MKKLLFLLMYSFGVSAQSYFQPDSTDFILFPHYQDSLQLSYEKEKEVYDAFFKEFAIYYNHQQQYARFAKMSVDALEMELFDSRLAQRKWISSHNFSDFAKNHLSKEAEFQYWHLLYAYPIVKSNADPKLRRVISNPDEITRPFKSVELKNEANLKYVAFRKLVPYWVTYENSKSNGFEKYTNLLLATNDKVEYTLKNTKGLVSDYALTQILHQNKPYLSMSLAQNIISQIQKEELSVPFLDTFLDDVYAHNAQKEAAKKAEEKSSVLSFTDLKGKSFDLSKYKGKVVYLDFWASWCGPCKMQFPYSKKLHDAIPAKMKKDIVFLYISIDDTEDAWKNGIEENDLKNFEHGYTPGAWGSAVLNKLGVRSIPRYMIFDKEGKLIDNNAKRPNHAEILSDLMRYAE